MSEKWDCLPFPRHCHRIVPKRCSIVLREIKKTFAPIDRVVQCNDYSRSSKLRHSPKQIGPIYFSMMMLLLPVWYTDHSLRALFIFSFSLGLSSIFGRWRSIHWTMAIVVVIREQRKKAYVFCTFVWIKTFIEEKKKTRGEVFLINRKDGCTVCYLMNEKKNHCFFPSLPFFARCFAFAVVKA